MNLKAIQFSTGRLFTFRENKNGKKSYNEKSGN